MVDRQEQIQQICCISTRTTAPTAAAAPHCSAAHVLCVFVLSVLSNRTYMEAYQDVLADSGSEPSALLSDALCITSTSATAGKPAGLSG